MITLTILLGFLSCGLVVARNGRQADLNPRWEHPHQPRVFTLDGFVQGEPVSDSVNRFTIPYAKPPVGKKRFMHPEPVKSWHSWKTPFDATQLQSACPNQAGPVPSVDEDCLYLNIYAPSDSSCGLASMVWLHGGSRSAIDPGLDGAALAEAENIIVVTVEYRGGMFGFLKNDDLGIPGNQGLQDIIMALHWIQKNIAFFKGNPSETTLVGQSTGGSLIRTLLATQPHRPSADWLFNRVILQSAPLNYGDHSVEVGNTLGALFASNTNCTSLQCLQSTSVADLLEDEATTVLTATSPSSEQYLPGVTVGEPFRPFIDGNLVIGNLLDGKTHMTRKDRSFIITDVEDEAAADIASLSADFSDDGTPRAIPEQYFSDVVSSLLLPQARSQTVLESGLYQPDSSNDDGVRDTLTILGTDYIWRCASQQAAVNGTESHETRGVYYGNFHIGITYVTNEDLDYCNDKVCHEDDILYVFGNTLDGQTLSANQENVQQEVMARWAAFAKGGDPNAEGYPEWKPVKNGDNLNMLNFGSKQDSGDSGSLSVVKQTFHAEACGPNGLWGNRAQFDVAIYGS